MSEDKTLHEAQELTGINRTTFLRWLVAVCGRGLE
jgi:hypothetical protein